MGHSEGQPQVNRSLSFKVAAIVRRRLPRDPMKRGAERTHCAESDIERDFGNRRGRICQKGLCAFDPSRRPVAMRRLSEGLLERSKEMIRAQSPQLGQQLKRNVLREVLFHEIDDTPLLPAGKPATV